MPSYWWRDFTDTNNVFSIFAFYICDNISTHNLLCEVFPQINHKTLYPRQVECANPLTEQQELHP